VQDEDLHASLDLVAGEIRGMVLESAADGPPQAMRVAEIRGLFDETIDAAVTLDAALDKASA